MQEKFKRCACAYEATEFALGVATIDERIQEVRVHEPYKLSPELIELHQQVAGHALEHLHNVRDFCNIDIEKEEKRLIKLQIDLLML